MNTKIKLSKSNYDYLKMLSAQSGQQLDDYLNGILVGVFALESIHQHYKAADPRAVAAVVASICGTV